MTETLISVRDLHQTYRGKLFRKGFHAIRGISLEVGRGTVFGLLGPNGAGKTTFIKVLLGLVRSWEGHAELFGSRPGEPKARRRIGYLPEAHRLPYYLTGRQVLHIYGLHAGRSSAWLNERIPRWLERVKMADSADRKVREYSKGMQQRIGLIQAMIHEPDLIFMDEPTDGVDPVGRRVVREIVRELKESGVTIFINSHLLMEVEAICDRVVIMDKGRIIREGSIDELTPKTGMVRFDVEAVPANLEALLDGIGGSHEADDQGFEIALNEGETDVIIDRLRASGVGIRAVVPRKLTLEDSFIELVRRQEEKDE
ncbi:MAG: ABC transporter ATP-binding protein [Planctomycetota bacterium]|nr:ABC transporter ATP-binding protein [Planctomycetota bacterium]